MLPLCLCYLPSLQLPRQRVESMYTKPCMSGHESVKDEMSSTVFVMNWCDLTYSNAQSRTACGSHTKKPRPSQNKTTHQLHSLEPSSDHTPQYHRAQTAKELKQKVTQPRPRMGPGLGAARWIWIRVLVIATLLRTTCTLICMRVADGWLEVRGEGFERNTVSTR